MTRFTDKKLQTMKAPIFEYVFNERSALQARVLSALEAGAGRVVVDLNRLSHLDTEDVRELIVLLRRSRQVGGDVALRALQPDVLRSLQSMALDRVFSMEAA